MDHHENENYDIGPPFSLDCNLAHLRTAQAGGPLGPDEIKWLDENVPLFGMGLYDFKANDWYPLAYELARTGIRQDLWLACCGDVQFKYPKPFIIPVKLSDPDQVREMMTNWFYVHLNMDIRPKWDDANQSLEGVRSSLRIKPDHVYAVLNAFATPQLVAEVHRGLAINQTLDIKGYETMFKDSSDTWRFASWILSPAVLGQNKVVEEFDIPDLGLGSP